MTTCVHECAQKVTCVNKLLCIISIRNIKRSIITWSAYGDYLFSLLHPSPVCCLPLRSSPTSLSLPPSIPLSCLSLLPLPSFHFLPFFSSSFLSPTLFVTIVSWERQILQTVAGPAGDPSSPRLIFSCPSLLSSCLLLSSSPGPSDDTDSVKAVSLT